MLLSPSYKNMYFWLDMDFNAQLVCKVREIERKDN